MAKRALEDVRCRVLRIRALAEPVGAVRVYTSDEWLRIREGISLAKHL
jgi:hypothetical protein